MLNRVRKIANNGHVLGVTDELFDLARLLGILLFQPIFFVPQEHKKGLYLPLELWEGVSGLVEN